MQERLAHKYHFKLVEDDLNDFIDSPESEDSTDSYDSATDDSIDSCDSDDTEALTHRKGIKTGTGCTMSGGASSESLTRTLSSAFMAKCAVVLSTAIALSLNRPTA